MSSSENRSSGMPLVSVLIVNYNYARFLGEAVESVFSQTYRNFEIVICDDGSTDRSPEVISGYATDHPTVIRPVLKSNGGVASALNAAFAVASGEVIAILDADDRFFPVKLERVVGELRAAPNAGLVVNRMVKFGDDGEMTGLIPQVGGLDSGHIRDDLLAAGGHWSFSPASGISLRRDCADKVFPIPEQEFRTEADAYIFTQAPMFFDVRALSEPLSYYRLHSSNVTASEHIDPAYARRIIAGIEKMCGALADTARALGLRDPRLEDNPTYTEMVLVRDYLENRGRIVVLKDLKRFWRAAYRCKSADRLRWRLKPLIMTTLLAMPRSLGAKVLESMYLPTGLRASIARRLVKSR